MDLDTLKTAIVLNELQFTNEELWNLSWEVLGYMKSYNPAMEERDKTLVWQLIFAVFNTLKMVK